MKKTKILSGIRVIDFGQYIAGPLTGVMLADMGATVIHIDPPGGPVYDVPINSMLLRGKKNIVLDLKKNEDSDIAKKLINTADIVIENFRPGVMAKLGLGAEECVKSNPMLIYCSIPGFSATDSKRSGIPGWEGIVLAEVGLLLANVDNLDNHEPCFNGMYMASVFAAEIAAHSIAAALVARERNGRGQIIEAPMYDACFEVGMNHGIYPKFSRTVTGDTYRRLKVITNYKCADGRYIVTSPPPRGAESLYEEIIPDRFKGLDEITEEFDAFLTELMKSKSSREWEYYAQLKHGAGISTSLTAAEWLRDDSAFASGTVVQVTDPILGKVYQPGAAVIIGEQSPAIKSVRSLPDADRKEVLQELETLTPPVGKSAHIENVKQALAGIKVLDFGQVLAGPIAGRIMAEYGAEVIKINNPWYADNPTAVAVHEAINNGKLTAFIDFKSPKGRAAVAKLIEDADIFHCNFSQNAYKNLSYTPEEIHKLNPHMIISQVNYHSLGSSRETFRGHEPLPEAETGISLRYSDTDKPKSLNLVLLDYSTGNVSAFAAILAVYHRYRTGEAVRVQAALTRSSTALVQIPYMIDYDGKVWDEPKGTKNLGWSKYNRMYKTADKWIYVAAMGKEQQLKTVADTENEKELEAAFASCSSKDWLKKLTGAGITAAVCRTFPEDAMEEEYAKERGLSVTREHRGMGTIRVTACSPRLTETPAVPGFPVANKGMNTREVMEKIGFKLN